MSFTTDVVTGNGAACYTTPKRVQELVKGLKTSLITALKSAEEKYRLNQQDLADFDEMLEMELREPVEILAPFFARTSGYPLKEGLEILNATSALIWLCWYILESRGGDANAKSSGLLWLAQSMPIWSIPKANTIRQAVAVVASAPRLMLCGDQLTAAGLEEPVWHRNRTMLQQPPKAMRAYIDTGPGSPVSDPWMNSGEPLFTPVLTGMDYIPIFTHAAASQPNNEHRKVWMQVYSSGVAVPIEVVVAAHRLIELHPAVAEGIYMYVHGLRIEYARLMQDPAPESRGYDSNLQMSSLGAPSMPVPTSKRSDSGKATYSRNANALLFWDISPKVAAEMIIQDSAGWSDIPNPEFGDERAEYIKSRSASAVKSRLLEARAAELSRPKPAASAPTQTPAPREGPELLASANGTLPASTQLPTLVSGSAWSKSLFAAATAKQGLASTMDQASITALTMPKPRSAMMASSDVKSPQSAPEITPDPPRPAIAGRWADDGNDDESEPELLPVEPEYDNNRGSKLMTSDASAEVKAHVNEAIEKLLNGERPAPELEGSWKGQEAPADIEKRAPAVVRNIERTNLAAEAPKEEFDYTTSRAAVRMMRVYDRVLAKAAYYNNNDFGLAMDTDRQNFCRALTRIIGVPERDTMTVLSGRENTVLTASAAAAAIAAANSCTQLQGDINELIDYLATASVGIERNAIEVMRSSNSVAATLGLKLDGKAASAFRFLTNSMLAPFAAKLAVAVEVETSDPLGAVYLLKAGGKGFGKVNELSLKAYIQMIKSGKSQDDVYLTLSEEVKTDYQYLCWISSTAGSYPDPSDSKTSAFKDRLNGAEKKPAPKQSAFAAAFTQ